ncbi:MAG: hypothetical protein IJT41_03795 [Clostridia bacterium]|nr:hypothetical protein [Clostridia bacterium]
MRRSIIPLILVLILMSGCARSEAQPAESETQTAESASQTEPAITEVTSETALSQTETAIPTQTKAFGTTVPPATTTALPVSTTVPPAQTTVSAPREGAYAFSVERFRVGTGTDDSRDPKAFILLSPQDVAAYFEEYDDVYHFSELREMNPGNPRDFDRLAEKYDADFFRTHQLILVQITEGSGSITNTVKAVRRTSPHAITVEIERYLPQVQTCDMAYAHFFVELETQDLQKADQIVVQRTEVHAPPSTVPAQ